MTSINVQFLEYIVPWHLTVSQFYSPIFHSKSRNKQPSSNNRPRPALRYRNRRAGNRQWDVRWQDSLAWSPSLYCPPCLDILLMSLFIFVLINIWRDREKASRQMMKELLKLTNKWFFYLPFGCDCQLETGLQNRANFLTNEFIHNLNRCVSLNQWRKSTIQNGSCSNFWGQQIVLCPFNIPILYMNFCSLVINCFTLYQGDSFCNLTFLGRVSIWRYVRCII